MNLYIFRPGFSKDSIQFFDCLTERVLLGHNYFLAVLLGISAGGFPSLVLSFLGNSPIKMIRGFSNQLRIGFSFFTQEMARILICQSRVISFENWGFM